MVAQNRNKSLNVWRKTIMSSTHLSEYGIEFDEKYLWQRVGRPSRGLFDRHPAFPGLRAALRRFTPGYAPSAPPAPNINVEIPAFGLEPKPT
jgi:hypothetical protein